MSDIKPWQIILIIIAVGVLAFSGWRMMGSGAPRTPSGYMTVDVLSGQLYLIKKGKAKGMMLPAKNPDTGERTLYPVVQEEGSGQWDLDDGYAQSIPNKMRDDSKVLGQGSKIEILDEDPIVYVLMK